MVLGRCQYQSMGRRAKALISAVNLVASCPPAVIAEVADQLVIADTLKINAARGSKLPSVLR